MIQPPSAERVIPLVSCTSCGNESNFEYLNDCIICNTCKAEYLIRNEILYFNTPPDNVPLRGTKKLLTKNWGTWRESNFEHIKAHLSQIPKDAYILDLGAGKSPYREYINRDVYQNLFSLDFAPFELIDVSANINKRLPFKQGAFDVIIFSNVLEHVLDPKTVLAECFRIMKKGGILIGQTPFLLGLHDEPYDFYRYTTYGIIHLLEDAGFNSIEVKELSTTDEMFKSLFGRFFDFHAARKNHVILLRIYRKLLFTLLFMIKKNFGEAKDPVLPKGYGWIGKKESN